MLFVHDAISKSDVFRIYFDEILRVADAWPAAVVHETECGASFSSDRVERQPVSIEITGSNGGTGDGAEAGKHEGESLEAHLCTALKKERGPAVRCCVAIAVLRMKRSTRESKMYKSNGEETKNEERKEERRRV